MVTKSILVIFLATLALSLAHKNESDVFSKVLGIAKYVLKLNQIEINKLPAELNAAYEKYEVPEKVNQAKSYLETQFERGIELTSKYLKIDESKKELKKSIEILKNKNPELEKKLNEFLQKINDLGGISKDIVKYLSDTDKIQGYYNKIISSSFHPLEQKVIEIIKKAKSGVIEAFKKGKDEVEEHFSKTSSK